MQKIYKKISKVVILISILVFISACSSNSTVTSIQEAPEKTVFSTEIPTDEPTPPIVPTTEPTSVPTEIPTPTEIPPLAVETMNAWCMPAAYGMPPVVESAVMPENARAFTQDGDQIKLIYPDSVCVFSFTFNQIAPEGLNLEWYDAGKSTAPWNVIPLHSDPADGNTAFGTTNHTFVIEPPFWFIRYSIALLAKDGTKLWDSPIYLERDWQPELCWNGVLPNPVTLACTKQQDLHPVDPGYCLFHACP